MNAKLALEGAMTAGGLTTEDAASIAGISHSTVRGILAERHRPSRLTLNALRQIPGFAERYDVAA